jgi:cell division septation protein DedD
MLHSMLSSSLRRVWALTALAMVFSVATTAVAQTPSLAEVARKEQERRKAQKTAGKVYTKKDLPPPPPPASGTAAPAPAQKAPPAAEKTGEEAKDEAWWKNRINAAREELRRNEIFAEALQTRINGLSTDFVNRDDPYQRAKIGDERDKALSELARVRADVARLKQQIDDIEEEARKAGVPPGWLR